MTNTFEEEMLEFAKELRQKAGKDNTPLEEATNAFKALAAFYAILKKHGKSDDESDGPSFGDLQDEVRDVIKQEALNGRTAPAVRGGSG